MRILYHRRLVDPFIFEVTTTSANTTMNLPLGGVGDSQLTWYNFYVDWGDGTEPQFVDISTSANKYHTYVNPGSYDITINGRCPYFGTVEESISASGTTQIRPYITKVKRWGNIRMESLCFQGCSNLTTLPVGPITGVLPTADIGSYLFDGCNNLVEIPTGLFDNCVGSTWFLWTFRDCWDIPSIPAGLFDNCPNVEFFGGTFKNCVGITSSIPTGLFDNNPDVIWFSETFMNCGLLSGSIPTGLFDNNTLSQCFDSVFYGCSSLTGSIPTGLFDNCPSVQDTIKGNSFRGTFYNCSGLTGSIPDYLFVNNTLATSFGLTFTHCSGLTGSIPSTLFTTNTLVTDFYETFNGCSGITGAVPSNLFTTNTLAVDFNSVFRETSVTSFSSTMFNANTEAVNMSAMFYDCHHIVQTIPVELFKYNTKVTSFAYLFNFCSGLTGSIPSDIFSYAPNLISVSAAFANCTGLTGSIPSGLLTNNPLLDQDGKFGVRNLFYNCHGLTGSIPSGLFTNQTLVTTFQGVFSGCYGLTGAIPSGLFDTNVNVGNGTSIGFDSTFQDCYSLTSAPALLFVNNTYATNFYRTFYGCNALQINRNLFCADANISTRFLNQSPNFQECFSRPLYSGTQGEAPFLWSFTYGTGTPTNIDCFAGAGNKIESLSNYCDIPTAWGGAGCTASYSQTHTANVAVSNGSWTNFASLGTNLRADDNTYVTTTATSYTDGVMRDFGFELPSDATITGIQVLVQWMKDYSFAANYIKVNLSKDGTNWGTESAAQSVSGSSEVLKTFGEVTSLWGLSLTAADINSPNFSLKLSGYVGSPYTISVEYVYLKVYYTAPPTVFTNINYGLTYNGYAFLDSRNIAAAGWRIPTEADYIATRDYLQGSATDWNNNTIGGALKSPGNIFFNTPNTSATNSSKLSFRAAGYANAAGWTYDFRNTAEYFCNSYGSPNDHRYTIAATYNSNTALRSFKPFAQGASIRLIKEDSTDPGSYTGNDGKIYPTVKIGNNVWLAANLAETKYRNGDDIPQGLAGGTWQTYGTALTGCWKYPNDNASNM